MGIFILLLIRKYFLNIATKTDSLIISDEVHEMHAPDEENIEESTIGDLSSDVSSYKDIKIVIAADKPTVSVMDMGKFSNNTDGHEEEDVDSIGWQMLLMSESCSNSGSDSESESSFSAMNSSGYNLTDETDNNGYDRDHDGCDDQDSLVWTSSTDYSQESKH
jgi:hypothetical protein